MARLIDDLLALSRVTRGEFHRASVDLSAIARGVAARLAQADPDRSVELVMPDELMVDGDERLLTIALENLIGNAWKFTRIRERGRIEIGAVGDDNSYFVRDNGAGFDMAYASKLFGMFQRLHSVNEFEGTGIGLATVKRIVRRHGGRIWSVEGSVGEGGDVLLHARWGRGPAGGRSARSRTKSPSRERRDGDMIRNAVILLVEDNPRDEALTLRALKKAGVPNRVVVARDGVEATRLFVFRSPCRWRP